MGPHVRVPLAVWSYWRCHLLLRRVEGHTRVGMCGIQNIWRRLGPVDNVEGIESVFGVWWDDVGVEAGRLAGADGGVCGERPVVPEGVAGEDGRWEFRSW